MLVENYVSFLATQGIVVVNLVPLGHRLAL